MSLPIENFEWDFEFETEAEGRDEAFMSCFSSLLISAAKRAVVHGQPTRAEDGFMDALIPVAADAYSRGPYIEQHGQYWDVYMVHSLQLFRVRLAVSVDENAAWYRVYEEQELWWSALEEKYSDTRLEVRIRPDEFPALTARVEVSGAESWTAHVRRTRKEVANVLLERLGSSISSAEGSKGGRLARQAKTRRIRRVRP